MTSQTRVSKYFLLHMRPNRLPAASLRFTHTFGLGGMSAVLCGLLLLTGPLMMFWYEPSPDRAHASLAALQQQTLFGDLVRGVHYWSANLLIAVLLLHLLRVFFTGARDGARRLNWVIGLGLLVTVLAANFTGYLLPWSQLSYWAVTICTGMLGYVPGLGGWLQQTVRGGSEVGGPTLIIFYTIHTTWVPAALAVLLGFHFWRVRKARGVVLPRRPGEPAADGGEQARGWPDLLIREITVGVVLAAAVVFLAVFFAPGPGEPANPGMSPNPAKAPWYFLGFQELQIHFHPVLAVLVIPLTLLAGLVWWPYRRREADQSGVLLGSAAGRQAALWAVLAGLVITPVLVLADARWPAAGTVIQGVVFVVLAAAVAGFRLILKKARPTTREDRDQALFVLLLTVMVVLTAVGVWFRGEGMALVRPW